MMTKIITAPAKESAAAFMASRKALVLNSRFRSHGVTLS
jgi:hypothetical protein